MLGGTSVIFLYQVDSIPHLGGTSQTKTKRKKDEDQTESLKLRRQGSFALLRCFSIKWIQFHTWTEPVEHDELSKTTLYNYKV